MLIDLTLPVTRQMLAEAPATKELFGHIGTHFDVMDKAFPLSYTERPAIVFDVSAVSHREVGPKDIDLNVVEEGMFVAFYTGYPEAVSYGAPGYFSQHPQLSETLIDALLQKGVSIIGIDCAGIRRGKEHIPADQRCADRGVFVIENLCRLKEVVQLGGSFTACTYPMNCEGITGLPCRVIAKVNCKERENGEVF